MIMNCINIMKLLYVCAATAGFLSLFVLVLYVLDRVAIVERLPPSRVATGAINNRCDNCVSNNRIMVENLKEE